MTTLWTGGTVDALGEMLKRECETMGAALRAKFDRENKALGIRIENMQSKANRSVGCQNVFDICSAVDSITSMTTSKSNTNNKISNIATFTGTTACTILPTIPSVDDNNMTSIVSSANNNSSELSVFENEDFISNSSDNECVTSKAIVAAASIYTSLLLGIISSPDLPTFLTITQNILFTSSVYDVYAMLIVVENYVFIGRVPFNIVNQYLILV